MALPAFVCPRCKGALGLHAEHYRCDACAADYPIVLGIPDFRVLPDPWIDFEDDRSKARRLAKLVASRSFEDAVRIYWDITPGTPRAQAERFTTAVLDAEARSREWLDRSERTEAPAREPWLDVGCGTGDMLAAATERGITIVGVDIALRWLIVAMRRDLLVDRSAQLVCANGEYLPFPPRTFGRVLSLGTIEHCRDADRLVAESRRVLRSGGVFHARTVNRYTILAEPHVGVWGVGLLPRRWADGYVRRRNGQRYLHHRPLSPRELARGLRRAGFSGVRVGAAALLATERARLGKAARSVATVYDRLREAPVARSVIRWLAPLLDARGTVA